MFVLWQSTEIYQPHAAARTRRSATLKPGSGRLGGSRGRWPVVDCVGAEKICPEVGAHARSSNTTMEQAPWIVLLLEVEDRNAPFQFICPP